MKCDFTGDVYVIGIPDNSTDFDPGPLLYNFNTSYEFYISRLSSAANFAWAYNYGPLTLGYINSFAIDANKNIYTCGSASYYPDWDIGPGTYTINPPVYNTLDIFVHKIAQDTGTFIRDIGIKENNFNNKISIFPNPSSAKFKIRTDGLIRLTDAVIFSMLGDEIKHVKLVNNLDEVDISEVKQGIYFLKLFSGLQVIETCKLIKSGD